MKIYTSTQTNKYQTSIKSLESIDETLSEEIIIEAKLSEIFHLKTEVDQILEKYGFESSASEKGVILVDAKSMGPLLVDELVKKLHELSSVMEIQKEKVGTTARSLLWVMLNVLKKTVLRQSISALCLAKNVSFRAVDA